MLKVNEANSRGSAAITINIANRPQLNGTLTRIEAAICKLFGEVRRGDSELFNMMLCTTEIYNNATKKDSQFPVEITLERKGNELHCKVKQSERFENPERIGMPQDKTARHGRGLFIVNTFTGGNLFFNGNEGEVSFIYAAKDLPNVPEKAIENEKPLVGN